MQTAPARAELDEVTLARAQRGDAAATRALVERYQRPVFALLARMLLGRAEVEDLAQETFMRVFTALPRFDRAGSAKLSTWILTIASRVALDQLARHAPAVRDVRDVRDPSDLAAIPARAADGADVGADRSALRRALEAAVAALPPAFRAAFLLREYHGLEYDEIARALDIELGTVRSRLARARAELRANLAEVHHS